MSIREIQLKNMYPDVKPCEHDDNAFDCKGKPRGHVGTVLRRGTEGYQSQKTESLKGNDR